VHSIYHYYQRLFKLRNDHDAFIYGDFKLYLENDDQCIVYTRRHNDQTLFVLANFFDNNVTLHLPEEIETLRAHYLIGNYDELLLSKQVTLRPYETRVYELLRL
jgi:oligo-1,6-glucosidase